MSKEYTYEVTENGYFIFIDGKKVIHQYEPYIPNKDLSYEENAKNQIEEMQISDYAVEIENETLTLEDAPKKLRTRIKEQLSLREKTRQQQPATKGEVTDIELALAEVYELIAGGVE